MRRTLATARQDPNSHATQVAPDRIMSALTMGAIIPGSNPEVADKIDPSVEKMTSPVNTKNERRAMTKGPKFTQC